MKTNDYFPEYSINSNVDIRNNSAWNNDCNLQRQSIEEIIKIIIDFLGEFLLFLSSIIECKQYYSQYQLQQIVDIAERIHQLRSTLIIQINYNNDDLKNSSSFDISSVCLILHELSSFIRCLCNEQQQHFGTIIEHPHTNILTQLLDRIEKLIKSCTDYVYMNNNSQYCQCSIPMIDNSVLSNGCKFSCNESNICMPWSFLEQIKNSTDRKDQILGLMYGIKNENIRRKLGYKIGKHQTSKRTKRNKFSNKKYKSDNDQKWIISSTDGEILPMHKSSMASTKSIFKITDPKEIERKSHNSIISQAKNSRQQSLVNSKQSSPIFRSNSDINKSIRLDSIHNRLIESNSNERMITNATSSHRGELPITSMLDHSVSQGTSSRRIQQQQLSDIDRDNDNKSTRSSSFHSYGYQTPSKTTIQISRESSQSLSPVQSKSINTRQTNISTLSPKTSPINDTREKKKSSTVARSNSKQNFKEIINENSSIYQTHTDNIDSAMMITSHDTIKQNGNLSNKSWQQRLASPTSITSAQRINSTHLSQNITSPISSKQSSLNKTLHDSNFQNYSDHQNTPSASFVNETYGDISLLNVVDGPQSVEGDKNQTNPSDITHKKDRSTPQLSSINTYRQQSTSATNDNNDLPLYTKTKKHVSHFVRDQKMRTDDIILQSNQQGYFHKLMNCFRRTNIDRSR